MSKLLPEIAKCRQCDFNGILTGGHGHAWYVQDWGVRAILEGRKTQTRRLAGLEEVNAAPDEWKLVVADVGLYRGDAKRPCFFAEFVNRRTGRQACAWCRQGAPGDLLWVREAWLRTPFGFAYRADPDMAYDENWRSPIYMPKRAARLWLLNKDVRCQRVQDISEEDVKAEGYGCRKGFMMGWKQINGEAAWDRNPWVFATTFERMERPK